MADTIFVICAIVEITYSSPHVRYNKTVKKYNIVSLCKKYIFIGKIFKMKSVSIYSKFYETYLSVIIFLIFKLHTNIYFIKNLLPIDNIPNKR